MGFTEIDLRYEIVFSPTSSWSMSQFLGDLDSKWSVVAEWLGRRTLNQRVVGSNPGVVSLSRIP
jgi:hypothetical protein